RAGRIDEVAAALHVGVEHALRLLALRSPTPIGPERHRPERERRDAQAGATEQAVVLERASGNGGSLCCRGWGSVGPFGGCWRRGSRKLRAAAELRSCRAFLGRSENVAISASIPRSVVNGIGDVHALKDEVVGPSAWQEVTQAMIDQFADLSGDHQWIHVDVE